jgi:hypothetical protein
MIYALFWVITQRMVVRNYHYLLRNNPEERRYHLLCGGSLKSRMYVNVLKFVTCHNVFYKLLQSCLSREVYVFYIYHIYLLVNYTFISVVPKIVKVVKHRVVWFVFA